MKLSDFPITNKWPAQHPERIQLYSLPTPTALKPLQCLKKQASPMSLTW